MNGCVAISVFKSQYVLFKVILVVAFRAVKGSVWSLSCLFVLILFIKKPEECRIVQQIADYGSIFALDSYVDNGLSGVFCHHAKQCLVCLEQLLQNLNLVVDHCKVNGA